MAGKVSIVLVGVGGYGNIYAEELLMTKNVNAYLKGVVDITLEKSRFYDEIKQRQIPVYDSLEKFYQEHDADLAIIATPIHLHKQQACLAMENGSHVLCEKPVTADIQELHDMIETRNRTNKMLAIGFNWSFTDSVQELKKDILAGKFGKPKRMKGLVLWPRNADYYNRSAWAGKQFGPNGERIFDSVLSNATAHFLHHLFYLNGDSISTSTKIKEIQAELYRANPIETFDTCAVHIQTTNDVEILYLASHAVENEYKPQYMLEFENATITYHPNDEGDEIIATWNSGKTKIYKSPERIHLRKLDLMVEAVKQNKKEVLCGPEAAGTHVYAIDGIHRSVDPIPKFPEEMIQYHEDRKLTTVNGLEDALKKSYQEFKMPAILGFEWTKLGKTIRYEQD